MIDNHEGKILEAWLFEHEMNNSQLAAKIGVSPQAVGQQLRKDDVAKTFKHKLSKAGIEIFAKPKSSDQLNNAALEAYKRLADTLEKQVRFEERFEGIFLKIDNAVSAHATRLDAVEKQLAKHTRAIGLVNDQTNDLQNQIIKITKSLKVNI